MSLYSLYRRRIKSRLPDPLRRAVSKTRWNLARAYYLLRIRPLATRALGPVFHRSRDLAELDITYLCNMRCFNCNRSCPQLPSRDSMSIGQVRRFIEDSRAAGVHWRRIRVLGGEPTLHPDLPQIVELLLDYRRNYSPRTMIQVTTNGHGSRVNAVLKKLPLQVNINNTAKASDVQEEFETFNIAPIDTATYATADFTNGCKVLEDCGLGVTPYGYYPCAVAGAIDRVFGFDAGRKSFPSPNDDMRGLLKLSCRLCGHFKLADQPRPVTAPVTSPTWDEAYRRAREHPVVLSRLPESPGDERGSGGVQQLDGWSISRAHSGGLEDCCLVIPTYCRPDEVIALLEHIAHQPDAPVEVAIVDGSPEDGLSRRMQDWRAACDPAFDLIYSRGPRGLTRQRNAGVDLTTKPYVFFLDDDALPLPGYFGAIASVLANDASKSIGGVCGYVLADPDDRVPRRWALRFALGIVPQIEPLRFGDSGTSVPSVRVKPFAGWRPVDIMPGCAFACRREVFERDRFSAFFDGYSQGEDVEMSLRLCASWKLVWCGDAHVKHNKAQSGRPAGYALGLMDVRNRYFLWKRHRPRAGFVDRLRFWLDIGLVVALDLVRACSGPGRRHALAHAAGLTRASLGCLISAPGYQEPPAARQYALKTAAIHS
ncbi:MAG: glycosyltransferase [Candidatus Solibacter sp.]|jgi:GT2 family glycosyltransferase